MISVKILAAVLAAACAVSLAACSSESSSSESAATTTTTETTESEDVLNIDMISDEIGGSGIVSDSESVSDTEESTSSSFADICDIDTSDIENPKLVLKEDLTVTFEGSESKTFQAGYELKKDEDFTVINNTSYYLIAGAGWFAQYCVPV